MFELLSKISPLNNLALFVFGYAVVAGFVHLLQSMKQSSPEDLYQGSQNEARGEMNVRIPKRRVFRLLANVGNSRVQY